MHEWMVDNGHTPHIVVDTSYDGVAVPKEHVKDGKIILNISESAAHNLRERCGSRERLDQNAGDSGIMILPRAPR